MRFGAASGSMAPARSDQALETASGLIAGARSAHGRSAQVLGDRVRVDGRRALRF